MGCALKVHKALGPGLLESAYEVCLAHEIGKAGLEVKRQFILPLVYDGVTIETGYRLDLLALDRVVIEVKAVEAINNVHRAQLLSYLKFGRWRLGYLSNFHVRHLRDGICRMANGL